MKEVAVQKWLSWGFLNLAIVAVYGMMMRYKIAFDFPYLDQKNLLHAHSHFAFSGWISQLLYAGIFLIIFPYLNEKKEKKYHFLLGLNLICSFGMLIAFTIQGYKAVSIFFSTLSIFIAVAYAIAFLYDQRFLPKDNPSRSWSLAALLLNVISSVGPLFLAFLMITKSVDNNLYLGSIYYYLHFQYNGWFFFGLMAVVSHYLYNSFRWSKTYFSVFLITVIPTFFLSMLWVKIPTWLYVSTVIATLLQLFSWFLILPKLYRGFKQRFANSSKLVRCFFGGAALAMTLKFCLQTISVVPHLSQLVFGFRPIVIAYLHLVLLGVYTLFLLGFLFEKKVILPSKALNIFAFIFFFGVILNELFLAIQGLAAFDYIPIPFINELLLAAAIVLVTGAVGMFLLKCKQIKR